MRSLWTPTGRWFVVAAVLTGVLLGLSACGGSSSDDAVTTLPATDKISTLPAGDTSISSARRQAQDHWPEFVTSFHDEPKLTHSVKASLPAKGGGRELIWVHVTAIDGDTVAGTLDNDPVRDLGLKYGDAVSVERRRIEDWAVFHDGKVVLGGYSFAPDESGTTTTG